MAMFAQITENERVKTGALYRERIDQYCAIIWKYM